MSHLEEIVTHLPRSVVLRFSKKCSTLSESLVCIELARNVCGGRGAIIAAMNVFEIPVQLAGVTLDEIIWYVFGTETVDGAIGTGGGDEVEFSDPSPISVGVGPQSVGYYSESGTLEEKKNKNKKLKNKKEKQREKIGGGEKERNEVMGTELRAVSDRLPYPGTRSGETSRPDPVDTPVHSQLPYSPTSSITGGFVEERAQVLNSWDEASAGTWWSGQTDLEAFPNKPSALLEKVNLQFRDVWLDASVKNWDLTRVMGKDKGLLAGLYNDQACSWVLWVLSSYHVIGQASLFLLRAIPRTPGSAKHLSTVVKALGCQSELWGASVCELETLMGRGVGRPKPWDDVKCRVRAKEFWNDKAANIDPRALERAIKEVLRDEMAVRPEWQNVSDYWSRRWLFTKAGAHSQYAEESWYGDKLDLPPRPTRREFAEAATLCPVGLGKPRVDAGLSWKDEHGKTRAIYSCDSRSYFTFDYLLKPIEAAWRNKVVLLDPGRRPQSVMYRELGMRQGFRYMLDFDDFNSQHTLEAMKMCTEIVCAGAPESILNWAVESWDNMHVHWMDGVVLREERMVGTLPSGHRATTFINSVLNAAYCRVVMGGAYSLCSALHTGDDVVMFGPDYAISHAVRAVARSPLRVNRSKQSVGNVSGEFLRVCFSRFGARGYPARSIASLVSGSWVSPYKIDKRSYLENLLRLSWTCASRSGNKGFGFLLRSSLMRRMPEIKGIVCEVLLHHRSVDGTPISVTPGGTIDVIRVSGGRVRTVRGRPMHTNATDDFIARHVDFKILERAEVTPGELRSAMLKASYKPTILPDDSQITTLRTTGPGLVSIDANLALRSTGREARGAGEALEILRSMRKDIDWRRIVAIVRGGESTGLTVRGKMEWPVATNYDLPFGDLMRMRDYLTWPSRARVSYPVRA